MKWCNHENHEHHQDQTLLAQCRARKAANGQQCNKCSTPALRFEDGSTDTWQYLATASQGLASFGQAPWKWLHTQPVICAGWHYDVHMVWSCMMLYGSRVFLKPLGRRRKDSHQRCSQAPQSHGLAISGNRSETKDVMSINDHVVFWRLD